MSSDLLRTRLGSLSGSTDRSARRPAAGAAPDASGGRLAILAPDFAQVTQTFIYDNLRTLAPDRTVLLAVDGDQADRFGLPVLSGLQPPRPAGDRLPEWTKAALSGLVSRYGPPLSSRDRTRMAAFLKAHGVTAMLAEFGKMGTMAGDVCAELGIPLHVRFHGYDATLHLRYPGIRRRYRRLFGQASSIICVSRHLADRLVAVGCPEELISVIPCGVDMDKFPPGQPESGRVLALGRLVDKKAPHLTIRAFAGIADRFPHAHLDVIGDGPLRGRCEAEIEAHGIRDRVTLHGAQLPETCRTHLRRAALFAQHSVTDADGNAEGSPVAIAEAMATGLPVVSTRHSGIADAVDDTVTGFLVEEGDVEGMARHLARLLADPALAMRMGKAGRARALEILDNRPIRARLRAILGLPALDL